MIPRRFASAWVAVLVCSISALAAADLHRAVRIVKAGEGFRPEHDGEPFFINGGAGGDAEGQRRQRRLHWPNGLDGAQKLGLVGLVGLPLGNPRHGFWFGAGSFAGKRKGASLAARAL